MPSAIYTPNAGANIKTVYAMAGMQILPAPASGYQGSHMLARMPQSTPKSQMKTHVGSEPHDTGNQSDDDGHTATLQLRRMPASGICRLSGR